MRRATGVWHLSEQSFPASAPVETQLRFLVRYAILAPSVRNTQPWTFAIEGNVVRLYADQSRGQPVADGGDRELYLSLGCALENLLVAAEYYGFGHRVEHLPLSVGQPAARIEFHPGGRPTPARAGLGHATLVSRHNDNGVFRSLPVPELIRRDLVGCRLEGEPRLDLTEDWLFRRWVDALTGEADHLDFANPEFRRELASWMARGVFRAPLPRLGALVVSRLDLGDTVARQDHRLVDSTGLFGVLSAADDDHLTHLRAGQLFERIWLRATAAGVSLHPMSQTMRHPALRAAIAELLPEPGMTPVHLFRLGYGYQDAESGPRTPRRPAEEVILGQPDPSR
jgi:nitroreductase